MLTFDYRKRISVDEALEHPFFKEIPKQDNNMHVNNIKQFVFIKDLPE